MAKTAMKSKEEILHKYDGSHLSLHTRALQAMDEYADELRKENELLWEANTRLKEENYALMMDNMTHEYYNAEAEKFAPEFEKQIREDERSGWIDFLDNVIFKDGVYNEGSLQAWQQFKKENNL